MIILNTKSAFISIVGRPNVGKSSLLNKIVKQKISIVSDKPQTTRTKINGVLNIGETQIVFIDTPGFHKPKNLLGKSMIKSIGEGMSEVDAVVLVVEAKTDFKLNDGEIPKAEEELIGKFSNKNVKKVLVINKIDLLTDKSDLLTVIDKYSQFCKFDEVVPVSAKSGEGVDILKDICCSYAKESVHYFDGMSTTDQPERFIVAELIREKILRLLDKEVPHGTAVDLERFYERDLKDGEPIIEVEAVIYCEKDSHKGIIIGKNGSMLKKIGSLARRDIEEFFGIKANVKIWVKTKEDWRNRQGLIHTFGLD